MESHIPGLTIKQKGANVQIHFYKMLFWDAVMDQFYGPCWRCEGMGV